MVSKNQANVSHLTFLIAPITTPITTDVYLLPIAKLQIYERPRN